MVFNHPIPVSIYSQEHNTALKVVDNFKYLGSWMASSDQDFYIRKAMALRDYHKIKSLSNSTLHINLYIRIFKITIEIIFLYGSETWTIDKRLRRKIDIYYTKLLIMVLNVSWRYMISNKILYNGMPLITDVIANRRMRINDHCLRHNNEIVQNLMGTKVLQEK